MQSIEFEQWWIKRCPEFDPITTDHVLEAWEFNRGKCNELAEMIDLIRKKFPVDSGLEDDEVERLDKLLEEFEQKNDH